jgi:hypothetical protein
MNQSYSNEKGGATIRWRDPEIDVSTRLVVGRLRLGSKSAVDSERGGEQSSPIDSVYKPNMILGSMELHFLLNAIPGYVQYDAIYHNCNTFTDYYHDEGKNRR